ncbi:uncharacterized protein KD926_006084 [Aspergillus affinis]|uniref:uncharacterized protein n=1 Tax=Aspergillus affinis TaxID=1070780 RepID=UPI0022FF062B|nr:uncharacterized protein KD926_006084 [Aspergillus affinis]KAI9042165.1 hypothetical protein KD926_006084 [Aspergillus affinis]
MGKHRKQQRNSQNELSRRGNPAEGRMSSRRPSFPPMFARDQDRHPRDGVSSGHPPHGWTGPPSPYTHPRNSTMQFVPGVHYPPAMQQPQIPSPGNGPGLPLLPPSEMNMRMMPANVPHPYFQRGNDNRGLRHRLFNEDYRYAGPQQVYAPPDVNGHFAEHLAYEYAVPNYAPETNGHRSEKFQLRGNAPVFVPRVQALREKSDDESAVYSSDQFRSSDSGIKVEEMGSRSDDSGRISSGDRVAWLVVSSTR